MKSRIKNQFLLSLLAVLCVLGVPGISDATLIGDTVVMQHMFGENISWTQSTIVAIGDSDIIHDDPLHPELDLYQVNVEASEIFITFTNQSSRYFNPELLGETVFNGLVISDLDDDSGNLLAGVSVDTNLVEYRTSDNWDPNMLSFTPDSISIDWANMQPAIEGTYFNISLVFKAAPVPEPATMLLLGLGLAGLAGVSRKKFKK